MLVAVILGLGGVGAVGAGASAVPVTSPSPDGGGRVVVRFADPDITESSGLVVVDGDLVTVNDSGGAPVIYSVDAVTGETVATTRFAPSQTDVEALAPVADDRGAVWVADIGNNDGSRSVITVTRVAVDGTSDLGSATSYDLSYPGGDAPDAEALLCDPRTGRLYVVTKAILGGTVYAAPARLHAGGPKRLRPVGRVGSVITDGAFWPDGRHVLLRNYGQLEVYSFPGLDLVATVPLPDQEQGEALAVDGDGSLLLTSEGEHAAVLRVQLPARVRALLDARPASSAAPSESESPSAASAPSSPSAPPAVDGDEQSAPADDRLLSTIMWLLLGGVVVAGGLLVVMFRRWYPSE